MPKIETCYLFIHKLIEISLLKKLSFIFNRLIKLEKRRKLSSKSVFMKSFSHFGVMKEKEAYS